MKRSTLVLCFSFSFAAIVAGCAHAQPEPVRVKASDIGKLEEGAIPPGRPIVIEIAEGETIPLDFSIDGDLVSTPSGTSIPLTAKRTFWIRIDKDGLKVSRDGEHFGTKPRVPGRFRMGVSATRARGVRGEIEIHTPTP
jgi:hypothetical protein